MEFGGAAWVGHPGQQRPGGEAPGVELPLSTLVSQIDRSRAR